MGQYYRIVNFDKEEYIDPYDFDNGAKLMEFSLQGNNFVNAMEKLLVSDWSGDRVAVVGDYISSYIKGGFIDNDDARRAAENLSAEFGSGSLYDGIGFSKADVRDGGKPVPFRYVLNCAAKEYVDLKVSPIQWVWHGTFPDTGKEAVRVGKISPIALLLCMNNGDGGSYYSSVCDDLVGAWVKDMGSIVPANEVPDGYTELYACFDEPSYAKDKPFLFDKGKRNDNFSIILDACREYPNADADDDWLFLSADEKKLVKESARKARLDALAEQKKADLKREGRHEQMIRKERLDLERRAADLEKEEKAACERAKALSDELEALEKELSAEN